MTDRSRVPDLGRYRASLASRQMWALMGAASLGALATTPVASLAKNSPAHTVPAPRIQEALRTHSLRTLDGKAFSLRSSEGQVVILNFWASWCSPCRKELPQLDALHASLSKQGVRVVAVSIDAEVANARRFRDKFGLTLPIAHDGPNGLARTLDLPSIPYTVVLDQQGRVAWSTHDSDAKALATLEATTRRLLVHAPPTQSAEGGAR